jgi:iron complex outermembrane receptor protein
VRRLAPVTSKELQGEIMRNILLGLYCGASMVATTAVFAQSTGGEGQAGENGATQSDSAFGLEEIVVTAQRRSESLQDVPVSVNALSADALKNQQVNTLDQLTLVAPSLQTGLGNFFAIRGVGTLANNVSVESSVAVAVDEVSIGQPAQLIDVFNDIERVEVLNGPQGLLFGRNSSAGLVNIVTKKPQLGEFANDFSLEAGSRDRPGNSSDTGYVVVRDALNLPIGEESALRINAVHSYDPMVVTNVHGGPEQNNDEKQSGARVKFYSNLTDRLSTYLIGEYLEFRGASVTTTRSIGAGPSISGPALAADGIVPGDDNYLFGADGPSFTRKTQKGLQGTLAYDFDSGWTISNIAAWKEFDRAASQDADSTSSDILNATGTTLTYEQFSNEFQVVLPSENRLSGQLGLYYFRGTSDIFSQTRGGFGVPAAAQPNAPFCVGPGASAGCTVRNDHVIGRDVTNRLVNTSYAVFGQFTYQLFDELKLIAGARQTEDEVEITADQNRFNYWRMLTPRASFDQERSDSNLSYKFGAQYEPTSDIMTYLTYGRGYKGPGSNTGAGSASAILTVLPETSNAFEAGVKSSFFDRRLVVDLALFHTKFENFQVQSFDPVLTAFIIRNAADVTSQGAELSISAMPFAGLTLSANGAYVDSEFDSFPGAQCYPGQPSPGCSTAGSFDAAGLSTPATPRFTSTVAGRYEMPVSATAAVFVSGNWYHRDSVNYAVNAAPGAQVGPIDLFGASLGLSIANAQLSVFCKNCTNKHYPIYVASSPLDSTVRVDSYVQEFGVNSVRTIGLALDYSF